MNFLQKKLILVAVLILGVGATNAQQDPQYTQYMYNTLSVNPAYVGSRDYSVLTLLARTQWVGLEGAPDTQTLSYDTNLNWRGVGLGFNIINDEIGPSKEISFDASLSYAINVSEEGKLALGLKLGGRHLNVDWNRVNLRETNDPDAVNVNKFLPTVGVGGYYYTDRFYFGLSVPNVLRTEHYNDALRGGSVAVERFHAFAIAGYVFDLSETVKFKPAALVKGVVGAPLSLDVSANFLFNEKIHAGLAWRWDDSISAMLGFQVSDKFRIGYAYDLTTSNYSNYNRGTHELLLQFQFAKPNAVASPRFF